MASSVNRRSVGIPQLPPQIDKTKFPLDASMSMRIRFDCQVQAKSDKGAFPLDAISMVILSNKDGCTYDMVPVDSKGCMKVDFQMGPFKPNVKLSQRIKMFFYFMDTKDNRHKPVCAGHMELTDLAEKVKDGKEFVCASNFTANQVTVRFNANADHSRDMFLDLLKLHNSKNIVPSVLSESAKHLNTIKELDEHVQAGLKNHTQILDDNGGKMFQSLMTAHIMENEATLYSLYQHDFSLPENMPPWLCTYLLAETLNHNAVTIEDVRKMDLRGIASFIGSYAQAPMRSVSACQYTFDETMVDDPEEFKKQKRSMMSEVFLRPFAHPYYGGLTKDDCEGLEVVMQTLTEYLGHLYKNYGNDICNTTNYMVYNDLKKRHFPDTMFHQSMTQTYQKQLMELGVFLGKFIEDQTIEFKLALVSANGASAGGDGGKTEIQAHACACLVCNDPKVQYTVLLEGTACTADDQKSKRIQLNGHLLPLTDVVNALTITPPFNTFTEQGFNTKMAMHMSHSHGSFYRTVFCEGDALIGTQIEESDLTFGVDMEHLANNSIKVYMPITGKHLKDKNALTELRQYVKDRRCEIHPPMVCHEDLCASLNWAPIQPFKGCKELDTTRQYTTCLVHVLADETHPMDKLLERATAEAAQFNASPKNLTVGVMRAFASMDGVSKVFHVYTDKLGNLASQLSLADNNKQQGN